MLLSLKLKKQKRRPSLHKYRPRKQKRTIKKSLKCCYTTKKHEEDGWSLLDSILSLLPSFFFVEDGAPDHSDCFLIFPSLSFSLNGVLHDGPTGTLWLLSSGGKVNGAKIAWPGRAIDSGGKVSIFSSLTFLVGTNSCSRLLMVGPWRGSKDPVITTWSSVWAHWNSPVPSPVDHLSYTR